jgi:molybdenum cofactor cytidylyltransferase
MNTAIVLLAAGSSSRMGQSKQLLKVHEETLLRRAATVALKAGIGPVVVVLGAGEVQHRAVLENLDIEIISNPLWEKGMGSSLKAGLEFLLSHYPGTDALIAMVCDQPLLTPDHLKKLAETHGQSAQPIVVSGYAGTVGVPALFDKSLFPEIATLRDEHGAKSIIAHHPHETVTVDFPEGAIDLDTPEDFKLYSDKTSE